MVERSVRDERTVVQLQHSQLGPGGAGLAELLDPLVSDELAVGEGEGGEGGAVGGQADQGGVGDQAALVQVQPGEGAAVLGQGLGGRYSRALIGQDPTILRSHWSRVMKYFHTDASLSLL